ncbi:MAG: noncanonical pyrimidine nucleotidase, YjjG family [Bacteroidetes bacterium HGW-Bacteroidetes-21]|nr:MAG: noncanonical pyrimidine nucleotidase, YjjG family [Bacteroidetes bacterium HGW-Bacteroidetes-21]
MPYKNLLFDLDRTLWDFESNTIETLRDIYDQFQLRLHFESFHHFYTTYRSINEKQWELYRNNRISKDTLRKSRFFLTLKEVGYEDNELADEIGTIYIEKTPLKTKIFPHTHESLTYLKPKYRLFILTNGFKEVQHKKLTGTHLDQYFEAVITSEDAGHQKPHLEFFTYVFDTLKIEPSESIMIGDALKVDIIGARNAGVDTVFFNPEDSVHKEIVTFEIQSLKELIHIF